MLYRLKSLNDMQARFLSWVRREKPDFVTKIIFYSLVLKGMDALNAKLKSLEESECYELCTLLKSLIDHLKG